MEWKPRIHTAEWMKKECHQSGNQLNIRNDHQLQSIHWTYTFSKPLSIKATELIITSTRERDRENIALTEALWWKSWLWSFMKCTTALFLNFIQTFVSTTTQYVHSLVFAELSSLMLQNKNTAKPGSYGKPGNCGAFFHPLCIIAQRIHQ